ncbi:hypothetical protein OSB04_000813 [Centaurea solstitialis]|uniref:MSP domain-containing protein n=1 Tax=Centaurea solstitialis TaxID=347529 RepID=A0AA38WL36_9ASTR|nr:hypothetical protein OSB04_000813 [Centaurea solstitialis]
MGQSMIGEDWSDARMNPRYLIDIVSRTYALLEKEAKVELKKQSSCSIQMINKTNQYVGFKVLMGFSRLDSKVKTTTRKKYCVRPHTGVIDPNSSCEFTASSHRRTLAAADRKSSKP